jgi:hypothetical protein
VELKNRHTGEIINLENAYEANKYIASGNFVEVKAEPVKEEPVKKEAKPEAEKPSAKK